MKHVQYTILPSLASRKHLLKQWQMMTRNQPIRPQCTVFFIWRCKCIYSGWYACDGNESEGVCMVHITCEFQYSSRHCTWGKHTNLHEKRAKIRACVLECGILNSNLVLQQFFLLENVLRWNHCRTMSTSTGKPSINKECELMGVERGHATVERRPLQCGECPNKEKQITSTRSAEKQLIQNYIPCFFQLTFLNQATSPKSNNPPLSVFYFESYFIQILGVWEEVHTPLLISSYRKWVPHITHPPMWPLEVHVTIRL